MSGVIRYFVPTSTDAPSVRAMAREAFSDTFGHLYDPSPFSVFLEQSYGPDGTMERDFGNPAISWFIAVTDRRPFGYAKLSPLVAPVPAPEAGAMELQQIYVLRQWHGQGVADRLTQ